MTLHNRKPAIFLVLVLAVIQCTGCSSSKKIGGAIIAYNEIPPNKTIADALNGQRTMILKPLIIVRDMPPSFDAPNGSLVEDASVSADRRDDRFRNTFDSVLRLTVLDQSASRAVQTPNMPIDSMRAYDSLTRIGLSGIYDLAIVPDQIEIAPGKEHADDSNDMTGETQGIRPDSPGSMSGGGGGRAGDRRGRNSGGGGTGNSMTIHCNYTIVRASDNKTIFSGQFTNPDVPLSGRGAMAAAIKSLCEQFLHWRSK